MKNLFLNQSGFSLVQGMILAAVVAGSGLVATRLLTDQKMAAKSAETRDQVEDLHSLIYSTLQNKKNCEHTMIANGQANFFTNNSTSTTKISRIYAYSGTGTGSSIVINVHAPTDALNTDVAAGTNNTYMNGNVSVEDISMTYNSATGIANLAIRYHRLDSANNMRTKQGYGAKDIQKNVQLRIQKNPWSTASNKPFESCYGISGENETNPNETNKEFCEQMFVSTYGATQRAFTWDQATGTCQVNTKCTDPNEIFTGIDSNGVVKCKNLTEWADLTKVIKPTTGTCAPGRSVRFNITDGGTRVNIHCD